MMEKTEIQVTHFDDLVDRVAQFESFQVAGKLYSADLLIPQLTIDAKDLLSEAASAAAFALYWGIEASRARRFHAQVCAAYRAWRDRMFLEFKAGEGASGKPPSDSVAEKMYRAHPDYAQWRGQQDSSQESAEIAEAIYEAFKIKVQMIKTAEQIMRTEADGPYVITEAPRKSSPRIPSTKGQ